MASNLEFVNYKQFVESLSSVDSAESTDESVICNSSNGPRKFDASRQNKLDNLKVISNAEYVFAVVDSNEIFLFGIKKDGSVEWQKGIPTPLKENIINLLSQKVDKEVGKSLIEENFSAAVSVESDLEFSLLVKDSTGRPIVGIKKDSTIYSFSKTNAASKNLSDEHSLAIPTPKCAIINFKNLGAAPQTKTSDYKAVVEFWDGDGVYFEKKAIVNAQGNSSLQFEKKNISIDFMNDDWIGDDAFKLKIGNWVSQDSFHLKAYYTDYFRGTGAVCYDIYKSMLDTHGCMENRTWKKALVPYSTNVGEGIGFGVMADDSLRVDDGALCFPEGFPCIVMMGGVFYGIYAFQLKKHRDNYMMKKSEKTHIHLDGEIGGSTFFGGTINWTSFEIRNPKDLICMDGTKYDGDNPSEIIDSTSPAYDSSNKKHVMTAAVKQSIIDFSNYYTTMSALSTETEKKEFFETVFDVDNIVDYQVFSDFVHNYDGFLKNWQWTTWDGKKWYVNAYDLDCAFGSSFLGDCIAVPETGFLGTGASLPTRFVQNSYRPKLESFYSQMRSAGIISVDAVVSRFEKWIQSIGLDFFKKEWERWPLSPCNRDMTVNSSYWTLKVDENENPVIVYEEGQNYYSDTTTYSVNNECTYNPAGKSKGWFYQFVAVAQTTGNNPVVQNGIRDSIWRVGRWVSKNIENMDNLYNYTEGA